MYVSLLNKEILFIIKYRRCTLNLHKIARCPEKCESLRNDFIFYKMVMHYVIKSCVSPLFLSAQALVNFNVNLFTFISKKYLNLSSFQGMKVSRIVSFCKFKFFAFSEAVYPLIKIDFTFFFEIFTLNISVVKG